VENAKSEKVQQDAANSLLTTLKAPVNTKVELDIGIATAGSVIEDYERAIEMMAQKQLELMQQGGDLLQITNASIKRPEEIEDSGVIDVTPEPVPVPAANTAQVPRLFE
jgi:hypothetical protein